MSATLAVQAFEQSTIEGYEEPQTYSYDNVDGKASYDIYYNHVDPYYCPEKNEKYDAYYASDLYCRVDGENLRHVFYVWETFEILASPELYFRYFAPLIDRTIGDLFGVIVTWDGCCTDSVWLTCEPYETISAEFVLYGFDNSDKTKINLLI